MYVKALHKLCITHQMWKMKAHMNQSETSLIRDVDKN